MPVSIEEATEVTVELVAALQRLMPQLSKSAPPVDADSLAGVIAQPGTTVFLARSDDDSAIVGTLTLVVFPIPTGWRAWIEDVVVDPAASGQNAGRLLTKAALDKAAGAGARTVELTSRPSREAANHIYKSMGFEVRETNVYRFSLE